MSANTYKRTAHSESNTVPPLLQKATWIWPELGFHHLLNLYARFRKVIKLEAVPKTATAWITADQFYRLSVNGRLVCRGPARGYQQNWSYDEVDLAPFLRKGRNLITVRAYNAGHGTFSYRTEGFAGLLFAARIGRQTVVSDAGWKCRRESGTRRDTWPYSMQLSGHQECVDLRGEDPDWETLGYDDSSWGNTEQCRLWNAPPYWTLEPRGIPVMREFTLKPKVVGTGGGRSRKTWQSASDLAGWRAGEPLGHQIADDPKPAFRVASTPKGRFRSVLLDFGRVVVGSPKITVRHAAGGETIDLLHTEVIDPDRLAPVVETTDHSRVRLANRLICREGRQNHAFFHHLGFRYLTLTVRENHSPLDIAVELQACGYPMEGEGTFHCDDPELNKIWETCAHTQRICSLDAYVDTPWREQAQWWGDARIQAWNTYHLSGDPRLLRRGIRILANQTTPDGLTYGHAPTIAHSCILPDFALIWILTLWDDYWQTGETIMLEAYHERVSTILDYFRRQTDPETGLIHHDPRYWLFLDWTDLQKDGQPALLSLWLLYTLRQLGELLRPSALPDDFEGVLEWTHKLESAIGERLIDDDGLIRDGLTSRGKPSAKKSLQAQTLAWMCELPGFDQDKALNEILLPWIREDQVSHAPPSSYWCAYPLDLLAREGYGEDIVAFIKRRWKGMAEFGSCFENFDPRPEGADMLSHSHAWSAHPLYLLMRTLGGVRQTAPGWGEIRFDPITSKKELDIRIATPKGTIRVHGDGSAPKLEKPKSVRLRKNNLLQ
ncbi:MAG: family 78 glycoside hydrolase catalytic domain [Verrucomicrobia bacterium]|jgi:hypothetical protein|nr:family 78 glycoside hydrolase catalytic domain [Verrucomicrobiota bacterium]